MARAVPYARTFPCSTLVIDGTTAGGELDSGRDWAHRITGRRFDNAA